MSRQRNIQGAGCARLLTKTCASALRVVFLALLLPSAVFAAPPRITSLGTTWGVLQTPGSAQPEDEDNTILQGAFEQGIVLADYGERLSPILFLKLDYSADTEDLDYNNKLKLGAGIKLRYQFADWGFAHAGVKYEYDHRFSSGRQLKGTQLFADWFAGWSMPQPSGAEQSNRIPLAFPGLTWGELRYPGSQDSLEDDDLIVEGSLEQGIDWFQLGNSSRSSPASKIRW
jgi:hypothetical protein